MPELNRPTQTDLDRMSHAEKDALILSLFDVLEEFGRRLKELEGKVEKTSQNSSKPPSSDGLKKAAAKPRNKGERPVGGVPGHQGSTRLMVDNPDRVEELRPRGFCACGTHHLRELDYCAELTGHGWPVELRRVLLDAKDAVAAAKAEGKTALDPAQLAGLQARYDRQIKIGLDAWPVRPPEPGGRKGPVKQHEATNLLLRLRDYKDQVLRFLTDWRVPFDNNLAERMVRPVKVKLKVIGGFRAVGGSEAFCVIRSVWETSKLNGLNPFDTLRLAFGGW